jgi:hypothetical protein
MDSTAHTTPSARPATRRRPTRLKVPAALAVIALSTSAALAPVSAAPAEHGTFQEDFTGTSPFAADSDTGRCVGYAGTTTETRTGSYKALTPGTGRRSEELKVVGRVAGHYLVTPDHPSDGPSYEGDYDEHVAGWVTEVDPEDTFRVVNYRLHGRLAGSDGSTLLIESKQKVTLRADGTAVVERQSSTCTVR